MRLIYLSPVPWSSFAQRPHKFVEWFHASTSGDVLWIDPYPTRFPLLSDLRKLKENKKLTNHQNPSWLKIANASCLPIEPLPASGWINHLFWKDLLKAIDNFSNQKPTLLAIGKPSALALVIAKRLRSTTSIYDAMDDFPSFYTGISHIAMKRREKELILHVTHVLASSTALKNYWSNTRSDIQLICNGLDPNNLPQPKINKKPKTKFVFGYAGTIGSWFDWEWIFKLAEMRPKDTVRLIGPIFKSPPNLIPKNIEILPPCTHDEILLKIKNFDIGLIPFKKNNLTNSVDPIKYYEYRALGLPIISTKFGEMIFHKEESGTFLSEGIQDINELINNALNYKADKKSTKEFIALNTWSARFSKINY